MTITTFNLLPHTHDGDEWMCCTLCRTSIQSRSLLERAKQRQVHWPETQQDKDMTCGEKESSNYANIDDAFASVLRYMNTTSKLCKRYYKCCESKSLQSSDSHHCRRFHTPRYTKAHRRNPLQTSEDVHLHVRPGTYAVTAGDAGSGGHQTHVVKLDHGQSVTMDFVI